MANRPYLYFSDEFSPHQTPPHRLEDGFKILEQQPRPHYEIAEETYMDSRHNTPFFWFLLFENADLFVDTTEGWDEIFLITNSAKALRLLDERLEKVAPFFASEDIDLSAEPYLSDYKRFKRAVSENLGTHLIFDPNELDHMGERNSWRTIFQTIDNLGTKGNGRELFDFVARNSFGLGGYFTQIGYPTMGLFGSIYHDV